jgi:hypothetical protein
VGGFRWLGLAVPRDPHSEDDLKGRYSLAQFIAEYQSGALPEKSFAIVSYETAKLGSGRVPAMTTRRLRVRWRDEAGKRHSEIQTVCACSMCGAIIAEDYDEETGAAQGPVTPGEAEQYVGLKRRFCQAPAPRRVWDADRGKHLLKTHDEDGNRYVCGSPLFENSGLRRIAAADYAKKKAKGVFGLCLVDEFRPLLKQLRSANAVNSVKLSPARQYRAKPARVGVETIDGASQLRHKRGFGMMR